MNSPRRCAVRSTLVRGAALALLLSLAPFAAAGTAATRERRAAEPAAARPVPAQSERPSSPAIVRALERVKAEPVPVGEVYALVTVTDRATGERRYVTRGEPRPEYAEYLRFPERAPASESYAESDDIYQYTIHYSLISTH